MMGIGIRHPQKRNEVCELEPLEANQLYVCMHSE